MITITNTFFRHLVLGFFTAVLFSAFIYLEHYGIDSQLLNTILALGAFFLLLSIPKKAILWSGFFIGILWFYWISYSFKYQGVGYIAPFVVLGFGILYLLYFLPLYFTNNPFIRAVLLFGLSFVEPLHWNWFKPELLFVQSYIGIFKFDYAIVLFSLAGFVYLLQKKHLRKYALTPLLAICLTCNPSYPPQKELPFKIKLIQTDIKQEEKWKPSNLPATLQMIAHEIDKAKQENYDIVVLPESVIPLYLNKNPKLLHEIQTLSKDITIILGTLHSENHQHFNVSYMFYKQQPFMAKKVVLVPFGEYIPLPDFAKKFVNDTFFGGSSDFTTAKKPTDFSINGIKIRNAICYEATSEELYQGDISFMVAMSNNAWFAPSIEPTLQRLLMQYYARKYGVTIYHSANYKGSGIIR